MSVARSGDDRRGSGEVYCREVSMGVEQIDGGFVPRLTQIWRYPVKSMIGATVGEAEVTTLGIVGDRFWALRDLERGGIRGAKKLKGLMEFAARSDGDSRVVITTPGGRDVSSSDVDVDDVLSEALGHRVRLESLPADGNLEHFLRGPRDSDDPLTELRAVFGREPEESLPNFAVFPPEVVQYESPPGTHYDCWPLLVVTTQALAALAAAVPGSNTDVRRFRPSLVVDTGGEPGHPEFGWKGRTARIGTSRVEFLDPCPRCVMVTHKVDAAVGEDREVLRHIVRDLDQNVGVYARILEPGSFRTGDPVVFD